MGGLVKKGNPSKRKKERAPRYIKDPADALPKQHQPRRKRPREPAKVPTKMQLLWTRDKGQCQLCGIDLKPASHPPEDDHASLDHIVAKSKGGTRDLSNLQLACRRCNGEKGSMSMDEFREWRHAKLLAESARE